MTELIQFPCAQCGAQIKVDGSTQTPTCAYCGTPALVPEAVWLRFHPAAPSPPSPVVQRTPRAGVVLWFLVGAILFAGAAVVVLVVAKASGGRGGADPSAAAPDALDPRASAGEPCNGRQHACSRDGKAELHCGLDGKMVIADTCKGPGACRVSPDGKSLTCDTTLADPNDPCATRDTACSTDHRAEIRCQGGRFAVLATCKGPDGCTLTPDGEGFTLSCDDHVADVGDPCFGSDRIACSSDKKSLLTCNAQRFGVDRACKKSCAIQKIAGTTSKRVACE